MVDDVFAIDAPIVERAKVIILGTQDLSARDALHIAIMEKHGIRQIMSFDEGFDGFPGIEGIAS